jgi:hypothetical protein
MDIVGLLCIECEHKWIILCPVGIDGGEIVTKINMFQDLCPICGAQADICDETQKIFPPQPILS